MSMKPDRLYQLLSFHFGYLSWWPVDNTYHQIHNSDPRFEIIIGAILTQNTAWSNVEKALYELKKHHVFTIKRMCSVKKNQLVSYIHSSGFFNQKAERLQSFSAYLDTVYEGNLDKFFNRSIREIRKELLQQNGIGPETADSILLYAGHLPVFVVDTYTKRLCNRLPLTVDSTKYEDVQLFFTKHLKRAYNKKDLVAVYQQCHAVIVEQAKRFCRTKPWCQECPLVDQCSFKKSM